MLTAGSVLQKERIRKNYSLDEVAAATKIQKHYLESLEKDEFEKFPSAVYAKGFLQNYANFLGINPSRLLALYRRSVGEAPPQPVKDGPQPIKQPKFLLTPTIIIIATVVLLVIGTLGYLIYQFYNFQKPPMLKLTYPEKNITVEEKEITLKGKTDPGMFVQVNDEAIKISDDGSFEVKLTLSEGTNTIIVKARHPDNIGKEAVITRNIEYKNPDEETTADSDQSETSDSDADSSSETDSDTNSQDEEQQDTDKINLELTVGPEDAWIQVETDGAQVEASVVLRNTTLNFTADEKIYVSTGKVSSTKIKINGEDQQFFIGDSGVGYIQCEKDGDEVICDRP